MADTKISALTTLASASLAAGDWFPVVDISDTSMAASGTTKKVAAEALMPEIGTWTPVFADANSGGNVATTSISGGHYIRIGKLVTVFARATNINTAGLTSANSLYIRGLPFSSLNNNNYRAHGLVFTSNFTLSYQNLIVYIANNTNFVQLYELTNNSSPIEIKINNINASAGLQITLTYITA